MTQGALKALSHVLAFSLARRDGAGVWATATWRKVDTRQPAPIGALVVLQAAPASVWCIGWLLNASANAYGPQYQIESLLDGRIAWWENVELLALNEEDQHPQWRWSDDQAKFDRRWYRLTREQHACYYRRSVFNGKAVTVGVQSFNHRAELQGAARDGHARDPQQAHAGGANRGADATVK